MGALPSRSFNAVSRHGVIVAGFIACAMALGGGGSPSPKAELLVQMAFVAALLAWFWWAPRKGAGVGASARELVWLGVALLALPLVQLIPLPPSVWQALPGRELERATLAVIGREDSWRALSISPSRTLAGLLALVPAVGVMWAAAVLPARDRRFVLLVMAAMALAGAALGAMQLAGGPDAFRLYEKSHRGWLTAFHANRNAAADALLIGALALSAWFASSAMPDFLARRRTPLLVTAQVLLVFAVILTGSRAGIALLALSLAVHWALLRPAGLDAKARALFAGMGAIVLGLAILPLGLSSSSRLAKVAERFDASSDARIPLWEDTLTAIAQFWPAGSGIGTFNLAFQPFESPAYLDAGSPNRAHNDYLEFLLEAGLLAPLMLVAGAVLLVLLARRGWRLSPKDHAAQLFAWGTLGIVALHSIVDYPLRNMAIACLAGVAAGFLAPAPRQGDGRAAQEGRKEGR